MLFMDFGMPICIPFTYRARDLVDLLQPLVTFEGMKKVTTHLMMRQFAKLWQHHELLGVLRTDCLVCQGEHAAECPDGTLRRFGYHMAHVMNFHVTSVGLPRVPM